MLKFGTALYQSRYHIFLQRKALLLNTNEGELFEAVIKKVLTNHNVKELVCNLGLAIQFLDFKAFKRLAFVYCVKFFLELIEDPRHRSGVSFIIVQF